MKYLFPILSILLLAAVFAVGGLLKLSLYGGNCCDIVGKSCDCFCCNSFGLRGYESCGVFGVLAGGVVGIIVGLIIYWVIRYYKK
ncbi:MAG: hypothetical protein UT48_C0001G0087 [Parcubacteria group bacterium GW2011_GWE2_39_37]|uniref:Uncharacterized protein n=1 Tax=Candidatus Falkowbacteria bacterium GW2011_GWF2_39_8 TaxID=1618642 RepID=A0A0G0Q053_9BACT|nr:MAG: hypothetical protein UT48_C0001G0087 [Parcubacteria group bacterium GW2011_GWE2_39_37]KKR33704.1 MAG: hypothetical protein UT64_C0004G0011 [Candidatus Falkowbacteria bacterium GW2011_GWF2_39_8]